MGKYRVDVTIQTFASHYIGEVECDSIEEFRKKADALWESQDWEAPRTNITNDFELGDEWEIVEVSEEDLKFYEVKPDEQ